MSKVELTPAEKTVLEYVQQALGAGAKRVTFDVSGSYGVHSRHPNLKTSMDSRNYSPWDGYDLVQGWKDAGANDAGVKVMRALLEGTGYTHKHIGEAVRGLQEKHLAAETPIHTVYFPKPQH